MQTYSILMKCWEYISLAIMIVILGLILAYFVKEIIMNFKRKKYTTYDSQKDIQRKIEKEQAKIDKFLKKQLKKVRKVRNL